MTFIGLNQKIKQKQKASIDPEPLCMNLKTPSKRHSSNSVTPTNHFSKYMRMIKALKPKNLAKKIRCPTNQIQTSNLMTLEDDLIHIKNKKISIPILKRFQKIKKPQNLSPNPESSHHRLSNSSEVNTLQKKNKSSFPSISFLKVDIPTCKRYSLSQLQPKTHNNRLKTEKPVRPLILIKSERKSSIPRVSLNKVEGAPNGNLLEFSRLKPTQQHFSKLQNVRIAQKLLLMQPSKELRKSEHIKFYNQQKTYRKRISHSALIKKNKICNKIKTEDKQHIRVNSQWVK